MVDAGGPNELPLIPVGSDRQELLQIVKYAGGETVKSIVPVKFVPMIGEDLEF